MGVIRGDAVRVPEEVGPVGVGVGGEAVAVWVEVGAYERVGVGEGGDGEADRDDAVGEWERRVAVAVRLLRDREGRERVAEVGVRVRSEAVGVYVRVMDHVQEYLSVGTAVQLRVGVSERDGVRGSVRLGLAEEQVSVRVSIDPEQLTEGVGVYVREAEDENVAVA